MFTAEIPAEGSSLSLPTTHQAPTLRQRRRRTWAGEPVASRIASPGPGAHAQCIIIPRIPGPGIGIQSWECCGRLSVNLAHAPRFSRAPRDRASVAAASIRAERPSRVARRGSRDTSQPFPARARPVFTRVFTFTSLFTFWIFHSGLAQWPSLRSEFWVAFTKIL